MITIKSSNCRGCLKKKTPIAETSNNISVVPDIKRGSRLKKVVEEKSLPVMRTWLRQFQGKERVADQKKVVVEGLIAVPAKKSRFSSGNRT